MADPLAPLPADLRSIAVLPEDGDYRLMRSSYMKVGSPSVVLVPRNEEEVCASVAYAA